MAYERPCVLSIAGLDPSGGAGLLADIKTFEQLRCLGFGVASALTAQTEDHFLSVDWLPLTAIQTQCAPLLERYPVTVIKIGIMQDLSTLLELINWLQEHNPGIQIVWDPVLAASSGFKLMEPTWNAVLPVLLQKITLLTPNTREAQLLSGLDDAPEAASRLALFCNILLKGGHAETEKGTDQLYTGTTKTAIKPGRQDLPAKHGSGCILSSAIAAQLALGLPLEEACRNAKQYIETALTSNEHLLAYHYVS